MGNGVLSWSIYLYEYIYRFICRLPCLPLSLFYPILDFFHNMLSVAPITAECPNHFTSLSWWNGMEKMLAYTLNAPKKKKSTLSHAECKRVATLCTFTLAFGVWLSEKIYFCPSVLWAVFFFFFFPPAWLIFILPLNWCVFVVVSVCPSLCLREIGARQSVFDVPKKLLMMTFLFVYQGFPTFFILPSMTLIWTLLPLNTRE